MSEKSGIVTVVDEDDDAGGSCVIGRIEWRSLKACMTSCVCSVVMRVWKAESSAIYSLISCWMLIVAVSRSLAAVSSVLISLCNVARLTEMV